MYIKRVKEIYPNEDFTQNYGDITLLVAKIKATNTVSSAGQVKVNGYFERTDVGNTMSEVLTDLYTNTSYGGGLNPDDLSFPTTTETVNCAYDTNMTIFDAMRKPALAQGYSLYLAGMDVILKKDGANSVLSGMYNEMNILRNSLKAQYLFKEEYPSYDGFECIYIDGCDWKPKSVKYPSTSTRPQRVDLFGVVDYTACVNGCEQVHEFDMLITTTLQPYFTPTGGTLTYEDLGDGTWHVWSDDNITRVTPDTNKNSMTHVTVRSGATITNCDGMFSQCNGLVSVNFNTFDMSNVTDMSSMFFGSINLIGVDFSRSKFTNKVTGMTSMFESCSGIEWINFENCDMSGAIYMTFMLKNATSLKCMTRFDTTGCDPNVLPYIFSNNPALVSPSASEIVTLTTSPGHLWVNSDPSPL